MDLRQQPPRSSRDLFAGAVGLGRTTDKARAFLNDTLGEYFYGYECPHDWAVFHVLGIDGAKYATMVQRLGDDRTLEAWVRTTYLDKLSPEIVAAWNEQLLKCGPGYAPPLIPEGNPLKHLTDEQFAGFRNTVAPGRTDIRAVVDLLDLEEGRAAVAP